MPVPIARCRVVNIAVRPNDTSLYVTEQTGRVQRLRRNGSSFTPDASAFVDVTQDVLRSDLHFRTVQVNVSKSF